MAKSIDGLVEVRKYVALGSGANGIVAAVEALSEMPDDCIVTEIIVRGMRTRPAAPVPEGTDS